MPISERVIWAASAATQGIEGEELGRGTKGGEVGIDLPIDLSNGRIEGIDLLQMQAQQEAVMLLHPAVECSAKILLRALDPRIGECGELGWIGLAGDDRRNDRSTSFAHHVGNRRVQFDVGLFERPLDALDVTGPLTNQLLAGA